MCRASRNAQCYDKDFGHTVQWIDDQACICEYTVIDESIRVS